MSYQSFEQVLQKCHTEGKEFWQVIMEDDMAERNVSKQDSMEHMRTTCCWQRLLMKEILSPPADLSAVTADEWRNILIVPGPSHCVGSMWTPALQELCRWANPMPA